MIAIEHENGGLHIKDTCGHVGPLHEAAHLEERITVIVDHGVGEDPGEQVAPPDNVVHPLQPGLAVYSLVAVVRSPLVTLVDLLPRAARKERPGDPNVLSGAGQ